MDHSESTAARIKLLVEAALAQKLAVGGSRGTTGPLGELYACERLRLTRAVDGMRGYDATDAEGRRVQIKSRAPEKGDHVNPIGTVGRIVSWEFDYALLVLLDGAYALDAIWMATQQDLAALQAKVRNPARGVRVNDFIRVGHRVDQTGSIKASGFTSERVKDALCWAMDLHAAQQRKGTAIPYAAHFLGVASLVLEDGGGEDEFIAAALHDAIEDTGVTASEIERRFGAVVARIVVAATDTLPDGRRREDTWRERKERYLVHLSTMAEDERRVALADKLHNARALLRDYREVGDVLWQRFNAGREDQRWYYQGLVNALPGPSANATELAIIVRELFE